MFFYTDLIRTKQLLTDQFFSDILGAELGDSINHQIQRFMKEKQTIALFSSRPLFFYLHWRLLGPSSCWIHAVGGKKEEERTVHKKPDCFHRSACYCHTTTTPVSHLPPLPILWTTQKLLHACCQGLKSLGKSISRKLVERSCCLQKLVMCSLHWCPWQTRRASLSTRTRPGEVQKLMPAVPPRGSVTPVSAVSTAYIPIVSPTLQNYSGSIISMHVSSPWKQVGL